MGALKRRVKSRIALSWCVCIAAAGARTVAKADPTGGGTRAGVEADPTTTSSSPGENAELGGLPPTEHLPHKPYLPYSFSVGGDSPPPIRPRSSRPINANGADVVSCGQCCFGPNPQTLTNFLSTLPSTSRYHDRLTAKNFYSKVIDVGGVPVVSSRDVSDEALQEAALTLAKLSAKQPHLLQILREEEVHVAVIGSREPLTSIPAYEVLELDANTDWNAYRGIGATQWLPVSSCAEENILCLQGDRYRDENICVHELSHSLQGSGGKLPTPRFVDFGEDDLGNFDLNERIKMVYEMGKGYLWTNTYASTNHEELWAEGVQSFYSVNYPHSSRVGDGIHNDIWRRDLLDDYHPELTSVIGKVFEASVSFDCPPTSLGACDCKSLQQICRLAGVEIVDETEEQSARPRTDSPTSGPTLEPTLAPSPMQPDATTNETPATPSPTPDDMLDLEDSAGGSFDGVEGGYETKTEEPSSAQQIHFAVMYTCVAAALIISIL